MTGYESKKNMARDKLEQWDTPSEAFNEWWNGEYDDSTNPFTKHSLAYWAFAGWQAALAQPEQEPFAGIKMWVGRTQIMRILTQTELHNAVDPWQHLERNAAVCIRALKEKNNE